jgi:hypothetical protein
MGGTELANTSPEPQQGGTQLSNQPSSLVGLESTDITKLTLKRRGREVSIDRTATGTWAGAGTTTALSQIVDRLLALRALPAFVGDPYKVAADELACPPIFIEARDRAGRTFHATIAIGLGRQSVGFAASGGVVTMPYVDCESLAAVLDVHAVAGRTSLQN